MSMHEVNEAAEVITSSIDGNAKVIFGAVVDESLGDEVKITVIATGFSSQIRPEVESDRVAKEEKVFSAPYNQPEPAEEKSNNVLTKNIFSKKTKIPVPDKVEIPPKSKEEEELEIPAFIRKKMGK